MDVKIVVVVNQCDNFLLLSHLFNYVHFAKACNKVYWTENISLAFYFNFSYSSLMMVLGPKHVGAF